MNGAGAREFSLVVAMDRKRGIGNKGDLPWPKLKGDMKFFRELTTCPDREAVEGRWGFRSEASHETAKWADVSAMLKFAQKLRDPKSDSENAVIMGRKTWDSLPEAFQPLPGRHNRVMTRSPRPINADNSSTLNESSVTYTAELITGAFRSELLIPEGVPGFPSFTSLSYAQIFVIGGGQIFAHSLRYFSCAHLYVTEIDAEFECDTFFPPTPGFQPVSFSPWIEENGVRYRFTRWDRTRVGGSP